MQVIKRRLSGKEGVDRARELRAILDELPGYRAVRVEVASASIVLPAILAATKLDEGQEGAPARLQAAVPDLRMVEYRCSMTPAWRHSKRQSGSSPASSGFTYATTTAPMPSLSPSTPARPSPTPLPRSTKRLGRPATAPASGGRPPALISQLVGREHMLQDGDTVEIVV